MVATNSIAPVEHISQELFEVVTQVCLAAPRGRKRAGDLKEIEFLTLSILQEHGTMIVGDIQRLLGVLPAQMSRIIRSLETRDSPMISCRINPQDKRKINVCLTPAGEKALREYQAVRVRRLVEILRDLPEEDQEDLDRLLHRLLEKVRAMPDLQTEGWDRSKTPAASPSPV
jgi:DNA-binding MarR family transcriptional regulator